MLGYKEVTLSDGQFAIHIKQRLKDQAKGLAVSYTHLDVYKRQANNGSGWQMPGLVACAKARNRFWIEGD